MTSKEQREALFQFFAGQFNQDWPMEAESPDEVVEKYIRQNRESGELQGLSDSIVSFVGDHPSDEDLSRALFMELGCFYSPSAIGDSTKTWLLGVAAKLAGASRGS